MVDDQYTTYELQDGFRMSRTVPDQFDTFLWLTDCFSLNKGKAGYIISMVFNEAPIGSTWNIISDNGEGKTSWKN